MEHWAQNDPIDRYVKRLLEEGWADAGEMETIDTRVAVELDAAAAQAERETLPEAESAIGGVYS